MNGDVTWISDFEAAFANQRRKNRGEAPIDITSGHYKGESRGPRYEPLFADGLAHLKDLPDSPRKSTALRTWDVVGGLIGASPENIRRDEDLAQQKRRRGAVGCSWFKCLMYGRETSKELFWCADCETALYCGSYCQEKCVTNEEV